MLESNNKGISIRRQCELLGISRSQYYYKSKPETAENIEIMRLIDLQYTKTPYYGVRRMTEQLRRKYGLIVNRKRVSRLMNLMGLVTIYRKPNLSKRNEEHKVYPYLLRDVEIERVNQVWSTDITYIPMKNGYMYLTAIIDWHSRYILSWSLSNSLGVASSVEALKEALKDSKPEIFNTDQGSQYTSEEFTGILEGLDIKISMDGRGRALDNIFVERFWRTIKYECVYLSEYQDGGELYRILRDYINFYNNERLHQSLDYLTPSEIYKSAIEHNNATTNCRSLQVGCIL